MTVATLASVSLALALLVALFALRQAHHRLSGARHSEVYARFMIERLLREAYADDKALRARGPHTYEEAMFNLDAVRRSASGRWWESDP
jgi:hypothetical protein